jgi:hypothetical protein
MSRKPGGRFWAGIIAALGAYAAAGYWLSSNGNTEEWLYRLGLTGATLIPVAFVVIYTQIAFRPETQVPWWRDEIGSSLVIAALSLVPLAGPLAWAFWFNGGMLTVSWVAWLAVSGPCISALAWLRLCWVWLRVSRTPKHSADYLKTQ